jgi:hypothetical protein
MTIYIVQVDRLDGYVMAMDANDPTMRTVATQRGAALAGLIEKALAASESHYISIDEIIDIDPLAAVREKPQAREDAHAAGAA